MLLFFFFFSYCHIVINERGWGGAYRDFEVSSSYLKFHFCFIASNNAGYFYVEYLGQRGSLKGKIIASFVPGLKFTAGLLIPFGYTEMKL